MCQRHTFLFAIGFGLCLFSSLISGRANEKSVTQGTSSTQLIGILKDRELIGGCGCYLHFPSDSQQRGVFSLDVDETEPWMNIGGRDVKLRLVRSVHPSKERVGSRSSETYEAPGIKVSATWVTTRMCGPNDEDCEVTNYKAVFTVTKGRQRQTVKLVGTCGC